MTDDIIGREGELSVIHGFFDRPPDGPRALVLDGEAGIGKSTLWHAGIASAWAQSFHVLTSRPAEAERTLGFVVLGDLFGDTDPEVLAALLNPRRHAFESALLREEPETPVDHRALGVAILTLLPALADGRPLVLAIDDDQWADPSSTAALVFALRRLGHSQYCSSLLGAPMATQRRGWRRHRPSRCGETPHRSAQRGCHPAAPSTSNGHLLPEADADAAPRRVSWQSVLRA